MVPIPFVSRKLSKLFVRQGFTPLFDVPVKIENPEEPLGTHVSYRNGIPERGNGYSLTVVDPDEFPRIEGATKWREAPVKQTALSVPSPDQAVGRRLNRIEIPQDTVERISKLRRRPLH